MSISPWRKKGNRFVWILNKHPCDQPGSSQTSAPTDYCKLHLHFLKAVCSVEKHVICQLICSEACCSRRSLQMALSDKPTVHWRWRLLDGLFTLYIILLFIICHFLYCAITSCGELHVLSCVYLHVSVERPLLLLNNVT